MKKLIILNEFTKLIENEIGQTAYWNELAICLSNSNI